MSPRSIESQRDFETALGRALSQKLRPSGKYCPTPGIIAAYFEGLLSPEEVEPCELHFSTCAGCQHEIAALVRMEIPGTRPEDEILGEPIWTRARVASAAAIGAIAGLALLLAIEFLVPLQSSSPNEVTTLLVETTPDHPSFSGAADSPEEDSPSDVASVPSPFLGEASEQSLANEPSPPVVAPSPDEHPASLDPPPVATSPISVANADGPPTATAPSPGEEKPLLSPTATPAALPEKPPRAAIPPHRPTPRPQPLALPRVSPREPERARLVPPTHTPAAAREAATPSILSVASPPASVRTEAPATAPPAKRPQDSGGALSALGRLLSGQILPVPARANRRTVIVVAPGTAGNVLWRIGTGGRIERSSDLGRTWKALASGVNVDLLAGAAASESVCWLVGRGGTIVRTTDGEHWQRIPSPTASNLLRVTARNAFAASVVAEGGETFMTSDGGRSWEQK